MKDMAHDRKTLLPMLSGFAEHTALALVYHLAPHSVGPDIYANAARILQRAAEDQAAGRDPRAHVKCVNGKMIEI